MTFKNRFTPILAATFASLLLLFFVRLFLWLRYSDVFSDLSAYETLQSFILGSRVDLISVLTFSSILILVATLPLKLVFNTYVRTFFGVLWGLITATIFAVSFGDALYFEYTLRHLSNELFNLSNDTNIIIDMALHSYLLYTVISTLSVLLIILFFTWLFRQKIENQNINVKSWASVLLVIVILFFGIRNKFTGKSFGTSDAFAVNKVSSGNLALNGFFSVYRTAKNTGYKNNHFPFDKALSITKAMLDSNMTQFNTKQAPIERTFINPEGKKYNVVFVLIESWGAEHLDSYTPYESLGVTPYFTYLSNHGMRFDNFYANGSRSIYGITSILTGVAKPAGFPPIGNGLEFSKLTYLASILKENGYDTLSMQGSSRRSYRMDSVMNLAGFDQYYGKSDIPNVETLDEGHSDGGIGTFDYNTLHFLHQKINTLKPPFFGFVFTASTHTDFHVPQKKYEKFEHSLSGYKGYMNTMYYADDAIKRFMNEAADEPWFDNTIFIFTGDHGYKSAARGLSKEMRHVTKAVASIEHHRVPLVIYAPKIIKPSKNPTLGSHTDILPTVIDLLGLQNSYASIGSSLLDSSIHERFVYIQEGSSMGLITENGYVKHNYKSIIESQTTTPQQLEEKLLSVDKVQTTLLKENRWAH